MNVIITLAILLNLYMIGDGIKSIIKTIKRNGKHKPS
jgi:uncharacterized protein with HEPN domain